MREDLAALDFELDAADVAAIENSEPWEMIGR
jgi:hypothetical protein